MRQTSGRRRAQDEDACHRPDSRAIRGNRERGEPASFVLEPRQAPPRGHPDPLQRDDGAHDQYDAGRPTSDRRSSRKATVRAKTSMTPSQQPTRETSQNSPGRCERPRAT